MTPRKRKTDRCVALKVYELATPYVQLAGWAAVAIPALYVAFSFVSDSNAHEERIARIEGAFRQVEDKANDQERKLANMDGKLDIILKYVRK